MTVLLSIGHGYCAAALARRLGPRGWHVIGTTRSPDRAAALEAAGVEPAIWPGADLDALIARATHLLSSVPPGPEGDPVIREAGAALSRGSHLRRAIYLSTTGVYGDHAGGWVDEDTPPAPATARGRARLAAEEGWRRLGLPLHIFRLAGIYGPGRGPFAKLRAGTARRIVKPGQVFSRIHVDDIAQALDASLALPGGAAGARVFNLCDDDPAPPQDVLAHAAGLIGLPPPPEEAFDTAEMSAMARSFYAESKRVRNDRARRELGLRLAHPDYRSGMAAVLAAEGGGR